jgi:hypothetical protein
MVSEGLFKNVQMQGAQKTEPRGVYPKGHAYGYTLSGVVCSAIRQTMCPSGDERFVKPTAFSGKEDVHL